MRTSRGKSRQRRHGNVDDVDDDHVGRADLLHVRRQRTGSAEVHAAGTIGPAREFSRRQESRSFSAWWMRPVFLIKDTWTSSTIASTSNTASMRARCVFPNDDQVLVPGMFARIRIPGSAAYDAVLIPDSPIGTDQSSQYVYIVVDGEIERRSGDTRPDRRRTPCGPDRTERRRIARHRRAAAGPAGDGGAN